MSNARETRRDVGNLQWNGIKRDVYVKRVLLGRNVYRNDAERFKRFPREKEIKYLLKDDLEI